MKITLVFYEYPAALHEIEAWERLQYNFTKMKLTKNQITYILHDEDERVACFDINDFDIKNINHEFKISPNAVYNKTLIFGKVEKNSLKNVINIIEKFENA